MRSDSQASALAPLVLLIRPCFINHPGLRAEFEQYAPMGLLTIAAILQSHGYEVRLLDLAESDDPLPLVFRYLQALEREPVAVGLTIYTESVQKCARIQDMVRRLLPRAKIIAGGPHVNFCYEEVLLQSPVDFVVRGEGEATIIELLEAILHPGLPLNLINGIGFRTSSGEVSCTPDRLPVRDLDQLPIPAYHLNPVRGRRRKLSLISSRGCIGNCVFCASRALSGSLYRTNSPEWMFSVVYAEYLREPFFWILILDDSFTINARRAIRFCKLLQAWDVKVGWSARSRVDALREDLVLNMALAGCRTVHIGVESADEFVLSNIGKGITMAQIRESVRLLVVNNITVVASFIFGLPHETRETMEKTLLLALAIREFGKESAGTCTPYPGTPLFVCRDQLGVQIKVQNWSFYNLITPIFETEAISLKDIAMIRILHSTYTFDSLPMNLLSANPHQELRMELSEWINEMKTLRNNTHAKQPPFALPRSSMQE